MTASPPAMRHDARDDVGTADDAPACTVCSHDLIAHDAIGLRYCRATQSQALSRNCICRAP